MSGRLELKVGDRVKIIKPLEFDVPLDWTYKVITITPKYSRFACRIESKTGWQCLMYNNEVEKISEKGKQLLFAFMDE